MTETQMVRPAVGTAGTRLNVTVNAYSVAIPSRIVYHYDLAVQGFVGSTGMAGDVPPKLGRQIFLYLKNQSKAFENAAVVYDGRKNVFSPQQFKWPDHTASFDIDISTNEEKAAAKRSRRFKIVITKVNDVKLDNLVKYIKHQVGSTPDEGVYMAITALNIICNHDMIMTHASSKNSFFPQPPPLGDRDSQSDFVLRMRGGLEMWRGYFSSIRMSPTGVILNFDLTSQPMIKAGNLALVAAEIAGSAGNPRALSGLTGQALTKLVRMLKLITVTVARVDGSKLRCKIKAVGSSARQMKFEAPVSPNSEQMRKWTVMEFIESTYNIKLKGPDLPLVRLTAKAWYPMEVCTVEAGQKYNKRLSPDQLAEAIRWLTVKPQERTRMLTEGVAQHLAKAPSLAPWGVKPDRTPLTIQARRLPPPILNYSTIQGGALKPSQTKVENGAWNMTQKALFRPVVINSWIAIAFTNGFSRFNEAAAKRSLSDLETAMRNVGIKIAPYTGGVFFDSRDAPLYEGDESDTVSPWILKRLPNKPQLIVCFLKEKNAWQYRQVKLFGDSMHGVATQCLSIDKLTTKGNAQYYANVVLKINAKLGGINHAIGDRGPLFTKVTTMVMGADVTHPGMDSFEPSIAAVVGSTNEHALGYAAEFSVQPGKQEIISSLDTMVMELMKKYNQRTGTLPQRLLFYRDGVSEGQFPQVINQEIPLLRKALTRIGTVVPKLKPLTDAMKVTFIVCGKRHHFKFGPTREGQRKDADRNGNLLPGVVIDTGVTHPFDFDWYGLSHAGLLGTSRAAHYTVLVDDANHKPDDLQLLTYHLCYVYSRSTRSVSIATPAYYAHHVCTRTKQLLGSLEPRMSSLTPTEADLDATLQAYRTKAATIRTAFQNVYLNAKNFPVPEYWM